MSKVLGIDYGTKRIGLAIGDEEQSIALPFDVIPYDDSVVGTLRRIIENEKIYRIIVGMPLGLAGNMTAKSAEAEDFVDLLQRHFPLPIITEDERLSSKLADQLFGEYKGKYDRDAVAAMVRVLDRFEPDPAANRTYEDLYRSVYLPMYDRLKPLYREIQRITGYPPT